MNKFKHPFLLSIASFAKTLTLMISSLLTFKASIKKGLIFIFTGLMVQVVSFTMGSCMICNDGPV
ncbi:MAG: hypothetical protein O9262_06655, partial [Cyclobacteriaceae bacterium]|nr:hypothetical protein [Cyclobacteriaceae bacterium]